MQCPVCHDEMELYQDENVHSKKKGIDYKRSKYVCRQDDIWGRLEVPQHPQEEIEEGEHMVLHQ